MINQQSSANLNALTSEIPVINITNAIFLHKDYQKVDDPYIPSRIGININDINDLFNLIKNNYVKDLFQKNIDRGDLKLLKKLAPDFDTINLMTQEITNIELSKTKSKNFLKGILYYIKEFYLFYKEKDRKPLFRPLKTEDRDLIGIFKS